MLAVTIKKDDMGRGVGQTATIAEKRSSMPILSNILLEAEGDELKLTATDMEITFQGSYPAQVETPGRLTVPARKLNEVVRLLGGEEISLKEGDNLTLHLAAGNFNTQMYGLSPDDFPQTAVPENIQFIEVEGRALADAIDKTIYAVAADETRYNLAGVYFEKVEYEGNLCLRLVSTDGHRLNLADFGADPAIAGLELPKGVLVSKKGLAELRKMADQNETVKLGMAQGSVVAKTATSMLVMRLLEGRFPDYHQVVPKDSDKPVVVDRKELSEALRRIATMSSDDYRAVKFTLAPGSLTMSSVAPDVGTAEEKIAAEYEGEAMESGFNPRYYIDALGTLASERVKLSFGEPMTPVILTGAEDPGYLGVIMTMKV